MQLFVRYIHQTLISDIISTSFPKQERYICIFVFDSQSSKMSVHTTPRYEYFSSVTDHLFTKMHHIPRAHVTMTLQAIFHPYFEGWITLSRGCVALVSLTLVQHLLIEIIRLVKLRHENTIRKHREFDSIKIISSSFYHRSKNIINFITVLLFSMYFKRLYFLFQPCKRKNIFLGILKL